jgi:hypothetical protein
VPELALAGTVSGEATFEGTPEDPRLTAEVAWREGSASGLDGLRADLELDYGAGRVALELRAEAAELGGVTVTGTAELPSSGPLPEALRHALWELDVSAELRDLARLSAGVWPSAPPLSGVVELRGRARGSLDSPRVELELDASDLLVAALAEPVEAAVFVAYERGRLRVLASAEDIDGELLMADLRAALGSLSLGSPGPETLRALTAADWRLRASVAERELQALLGPGRLPSPALWVSAELELSSSPHDGTRGELRLRGRSPVDEVSSDAVRPRPAEPASGLHDAWQEREHCGAPGSSTELIVRLEPEVAHAALRTRSSAEEPAPRGGSGLPSQPVLLATLWAPGPWLDWLARDQHGSEVLRAELRADALELNRLPWVCTRATGVVRGEVALVGPADDLVPSGSVEVEGLDLATGSSEGRQRLTNLSGRIGLEPGRLTYDLHGPHTEGDVRLEGALELSGLQIQSLELDAALTRLPVRYAGLAVVHLSTHTAVRVELSEAHADLALSFQELVIALPEPLPNRMLSLERNPDFLFTEEVSLADDLEAAGLTEADGPALPAAPPARTVDLRIDASEPFWATRSDAEVEMTAELRLTVDREGEVRLEGPVDIRQGFLQLLGRRFELEPGRIEFAGELLDASVDLSAVHEPDRYPSERVTARITGRLSAPVLELSTTVPGVSSQAHIAGLLLTDRVGGAGVASEGPQTQVTSFLGALTLGLLTLTARSELLQWVPIILVRPGANLAEGQVRGGFPLDWFVPSEFLGLATGAHVGPHPSAERAEEVGPRQESLGGPEASTGSRLELSLPRGLHSITSFEPPAGWSQELLWQP